MPRAVPLTKYIEGKEAEQIINAIIDIANILSQLHMRSISHRDIKPSNILVIKNEYFLGDFGLVDYPDKDDITLDREEIGAKWTIAPWMRRDSSTADGKSADIYSLAKTLWILLTRQKKGFDGQYNTNSILAIKKYVPSIYCSPIDDLLSLCTDPDPKKIPDVNYFINKLTNWKVLQKDFKKLSRSEWENISKKLFPAAIPKRAFLEDIDDIIKVLNILSEEIIEDNIIAHVFFPDGGGFDLSGAKISYEEGCLELNLYTAYIIKPKRLIFESFPNNSDWNYFRLETEKLEQLVEHSSEINEEAFTEIEPLKYTDLECYGYNDFNGDRLPKTARCIRRILNGTFLICLKTSVYNHDSTTYDGRHNNMSTDEFRDYIEKSIKKIEGKGSKDIQTEKKPEYMKSTKIRKGNRSLNKEEITLLRKVIELSTEAEKENRNIKDKYEIHNFINIADDKLMEAFKLSLEPKRKETELDKFLRSLSPEEIVLIAATMYGGRDKLSQGRAYPLDEMIEFHNIKTSDGLIYSITEKSCLSDYLNAGLEAYISL